MDTVSEEENISVWKQGAIVLVSPGIVASFPAEPSRRAIYNGDEIQSSKAYHDIAVVKWSAGIGMCKFVPVAHRT